MCQPPLSGTHMIYACCKKKFHCFIFSWCGLYVSVGGWRWLQSIFLHMYELPSIQLRICIATAGETITINRLIWIYLNNDNYSENRYANNSNNLGMFESAVDSAPYLDSFFPCAFYYLLCAMCIRARLAHSHFIVSLIFTFIPLTMITAQTHSSSHLFGYIVVAVQHIAGLFFCLIHLYIVIHMSTSKKKIGWALTKREKGRNDCFSSYHPWEAKQIVTSTWLHSAYE